ncbi:MAG: glycoside hydrolase family 16 protein [Clostridia bacterium]|nr:glycoside hydrolase family 16 protein [Clostridia bacterium]
MLTAFEVDVLKDNVIYHKGNIEAVEWGNFVSLTDGNGISLDMGRVTAQLSALNGEAFVTFAYSNPTGEYIYSDPVKMYLYYSVSSVEDWKAINSDLTAWYAQTEDIDFAACNLSTQSLSVARSITPDSLAADAPTSALSFDGVYDGNGYALKNYNDTAKNFSGIYTEEVYVQSLFAKIGRTGFVRNVKLDNVKIFSRNFTGMLVGENYGTVSDVHLIDCEVLNMYGAGALVCAYNYGSINFTVLENCSVRIMPNSANDYVISFVNGGVIAQSLASGISFFNGATGQTPYQTTGKVTSGSGTVKNVNGQDGTAFNSLTNVSLCDMRKYGYRGDIWGSTGIANLKEGSLEARNNSSTYYLDSWVVQNRVWGFTGTQSHGGVIADNLTYDEEGNLVFIVNGDYYEGDKKGINEAYYGVNGGKRTGATIKSRNTYGPGSFEAVMKIPSFNGICTSIWLFNYIERDGQEASNYEIDIEVHGTAVDSNGNPINTNNLSSVLCTSWLTETNFISETKGVGYALNDGDFHSYRIDWHTGENPRVEYYIDGILVCTQTTHVPDNEMYLNIGCWFPKDWCGDPAFETDYMTLKSFSYTPFAGETAGKLSTATDNGREGEVYHPWVEMPKNNLLANGNFDINRTNPVWNIPLGATVNDGITFSGTLSQTVYMDCGGVDYRLAILASGKAEVKLSYLSIVNGVTVSGSKSFSLNNATLTGSIFDFTPPDNCTAFKLEIISEGQINVKSANLNIA